MLSSNVNGPGIRPSQLTARLPVVVLMPLLSVHSLCTISLLASLYEHAVAARPQNYSSRADVACCPPGCLEIMTVLPYYRRPCGPPPDRSVAACCNVLCRMPSSVHDTASWYHAFLGPCMHGMRQSRGIGALTLVTEHCPTCRWISPMALISNRLLLDP